MTDTISRPPGASAAGVLEIAARIGATGRAAVEAEGSNRRARIAQYLFQVPLSCIVTITAGAGAAQFPDTMGPGAGYYWNIRRLSVQGFTAGSVIVYKNAPPVGGVVVGTPEVFVPFPQAGTATLGRGEGLLNPTDALTISGTGITVATGYAGLQVNGVADCFPAWLLPDYLI